MRDDAIGTRPVVDATETARTIVALMGGARMTGFLPVIIATIATATNVVTAATTDTIRSGRR